MISVQRAIISNPGLQHLSSPSSLRDLKFLLLHRAKTAQHWPDYWECPGGKADSPDEQASQTLVREVFQETHLQVHPHFTEYVGKYPGLSSEQFGLPETVSYLATFHLVVADLREVVLSDEHDRYIWVALPELLTEFTEKVRPCSLHALREAYVYHIPELIRENKLPSLQRV